MDMLLEAHGGDNIHKVNADYVSASLVPIWLVHGYRAAHISTSFTWSSELTNFHL